MEAEVKCDFYVSLMFYDFFFVYFNCCYIMLKDNVYTFFECIFLKKILNDKVKCF